MEFSKLNWRHRILSVDFGYASTIPVRKNGRCNFRLSGKSPVSCEGKLPDLAAAGNWYEDGLVGVHAVYVPRGEYWLAVQLHAPGIHQPIILDVTSVALEKK